MTEGTLKVEYLLNDQVKVQQEMNQLELAALLLDENVLLLSVNKGKVHRRKHRKEHRGHDQ